jgi:hypothetical protein
LPKSLVVLDARLIEKQFHLFLFAMGKLHINNTIIQIAFAWSALFDLKGN